MTGMTTATGERNSSVAIINMFDINLPSSPASGY